MADTPTDPAPAAVSPPDASAPAESDATINDLQANMDALAASAAALDQAAKTASDIVQQVQSVAPAEALAPTEKSAAQQVSADPASPADAASTAHPAAIPPELRRLLAIEVPIIVRLGVRKMSVGEVIRFAVGAIIELQKASDEDLDLLANNLPIGKGQAVKVGENFGIRLTHVASVKETIRKLGGA
jgi:flagellar motor switch protein FliN/FliY